MSYEKELLLNEIKEQVGRSTSMIPIQYGCLPPGKVWTLRSNLAKSGSTLEVVRRRVFLKAAALSGINFDETLFKGNVGVVFVNQENSMDALKDVFKFKNDHPELKLGVLCGHIDGKPMTGAEVEYLAKLPSLDVMRSQFIALLVSPMTLTLSVMEAAIEGPLSASAEQTTQTE